MIDDNEHFIAGMAHCYDLLAQELRVKREAFQTVWAFYYEHVDFVGDAESTVSKELAFASSVIEHLETNLKWQYFDAISHDRNAVQWPDMQHEEDSLG